MGNTIDDSKTHAENKEEANDTLNSMMRIANQNLKLFESVVTSANDQNLVKIDKILAKRSIIRCGVSKDGGDLGGEISGILGDFVSGDFLGGISNTINLAMQVVLSSYAGNESETEGFVVSVGALGGFYKVDYYMYSYQFTSEALQKITENVCCCAVYISSIHTDDLTKNTVNTILQMAFPETDVETLKVMRDEIYAALGFDANTHPEMTVAQRKMQPYVRVPKPANKLKVNKRPRDADSDDDAKADQ